MSPATSTMSINQNNVYVHSNPPKAISGSGAVIRQWVRNGDIEKLEKLLLEGQGARLLGMVESSQDSRVKTFLRSVPGYMAKVDLIHDAVVRGSLRETQTLIDKKKLATARDAVGRGVGHKAVIYNNKSILEWMGKKHPETLNLKDNEGRTCLHYVAASKEPDEMYDVLIGLGSDPDIIDMHGKKASYYISHPEELDIEGPTSNQRTLSRGKRRRISPISPPKRKLLVSPPSITRAQIRIWIHEKDIPKLERIVWSGNGDKLLLETTNNGKVRRFLENVPHLLSRIKSIHGVAINNDLEGLKEMRTKTELNEIFKAKDLHGLTPLHKAAGLGNRGIIEYLIYEIPDALNEIDNEGRNPLHYAARDPVIYSFLVKGGADENILDHKGKSPSYYRSHPLEIDIRHLRNVPDAPRVSGDLSGWDRSSPPLLIKRRSSSGEFSGIDSKDQANTTGKYELMDMELREGDLQIDEIDFVPSTDEPVVEDEFIQSEIISTEETSTLNDETFPNEISGNDLPITRRESIIQNEEQVIVNNTILENNSIQDELEQGEETLEDQAPPNNLESEELFDGKLTEGDEVSEIPNEVIQEVIVAEQLATDLIEENITVEESEMIQEIQVMDNVMNTEEPIEKIDEDFEVMEFISDPSIELIDGYEANASNVLEDKDEEETIVDNSKIEVEDNIEEETIVDNSSNIEEETIVDNSSNIEEETIVDNSSNIEEETIVDNSSNIEKETIIESIEEKEEASVEQLLTEDILDEEMKSTVIDDIDAKEEIVELNEDVDNALLENPSNEMDEVEAALNKGDMESLVSKILDGKGDELLNRETDNAEVQEFLSNVPAYMVKIGSIHYAASNGNVRDLQSLLDRKRLALCRDKLGRGPLHLAVLHNHATVAKYLAGTYPQSLKLLDLNGRSPLHYGATLNDGGTMYKYLVNLGGDPNVKDIEGNTPGIYLRNRELLSHKDLMVEGDIDNGNRESPIQRWERPKTPTVSTLNTLETFYNTTLMKDESLWTKAWRRLTHQSESSNKQLVQKYLDRRTFNLIKNRGMTDGSSLLDILKFYPQFFIIASGEEAYDVFQELFVPPIVDHNRIYGQFKAQSSILGRGPLIEFNIPQVDIPSKFVTQVRFRLSRNIRPFPFISQMKKEDLIHVTNLLKTIQLNWPCFHLEDLEKVELENLKLKSWMPEATKISRLWPKHRYFILSHDGSVQIWMNAEDHLDLIVSSKYGRLYPMFETLNNIYMRFSKGFKFYENIQFGFLTVDPFRVGTALKITFRIRLPNLMKDKDELDSLCCAHNLSIRWKSSRIESSEIDPNDWIEIENNTTLGKSELELGLDIANSVNRLIKAEEEKARLLLLMSKDINKK